MGTEKFDTFTERARQVLAYAQDEAQRLNHNYIGTEHLLLGLVREGDGVAARVLRGMDVQLPKVRSAVDFIIGRGETMIMGHIGLTPRAKKVIELAVDEARQLGHRQLGTEHLLLGLVREGEGIAAGVLDSLGVDLERLRAEVLHALGEPAGAHSPQRSARLIPEEIMRLLGPFDERARRVLAIAREEARRLNHPTIGPAHFLLGLIRESEEAAQELPNSHQLRDYVSRALGEYPTKDAGDGQ